MGSPVALETVGMIVAMVLGTSGVVGLLNWMTSARKGRVDESTATVASMNETNQTLLSTLLFLRSEIDKLTENDRRQDQRIRDQEAEICSLRRDRDRDRRWIRRAAIIIDTEVPASRRIAPPDWLTGGHQPD